jgi:hypothetical protein
MPGTPDPNMGVRNYPNSEIGLANCDANSVEPMGPGPAIDTLTSICIILSFIVQVVSQMIPRFFI